MNTIKHLLLLVMVLGILVPASLAQTNSGSPLDELASLVPNECQRTVASIPALRGVRLGMGKEELLKLIRPTSVQVVALTGRIGASDFIDTENGRDLISLDFKLFADRVIFISIFYRQWSGDGVRDAIKPLSDQLGLNFKCWQSAELGTKYTYDGKDVQAKLGFRQLELTDVAATAAKVSAAKKAEEERKKAFKF